MTSPQEPQHRESFLSRHKVLIIVGLVVALIVLCWLICAQGSGDKS
ncbi:hypothetical protein GCM10009682_43280 [Luedemannella flava]|uniref:Uncharacterized protein n=1 Tax=Luedemannella flava TaxID=349316 RepID=A0ABP4YL11_9ACTN